ncbi:hypothetical protein GOP47_0016418 [Adiantum capillus-veneris]|uniref:Protein kinase domain-containing protein n=1 Tax=Adiantum capillus-veneris TaxID=13818 RepID=A0A9D4UIJ5_ADICA|nr:hypothetical protein GOP47_0016418 [Adiantum capillus-veneris]
MRSLHWSRCPQQGFCDADWSAPEPKRDRASLCFCNPRRKRALHDTYLSSSLAVATPLRRSIAFASYQGLPTSDSLARQLFVTAQPPPPSALQQLSDNPLAPLPGELQELLSSLSLQFSELVNKFSNQTEIKKLASSLSSWLSDAITVSNYQSEFRELASSFSNTVSEATNKFREADINQLFGQLYTQISETKEALVNSSDELVQQIEASTTQTASQLVGNLKTFSNGAQFDPIKLRVYIQDALRQLSDVVEHPEDFQQQFDKVPTYANNILIFLRNMLMQLVDSVSFTQGLSPSANSSLPSNTLIVLVTICCALILVAVQMTSNAKKPSLSDGRDLPSRYDPDAIEAYFSDRPADVYLRLLQVVYEFSSFATSLLIDKTMGLDKENEKVRAVELVGLIAKLGPTAIKIGQALSIRPDILPVSYLEELQKLQDRVPPFPNEEAEKLILDGVGRFVEDVFSEFSPEPIAAASLGQVYKAKLKDTGDIVAVKVQRPGVLEGICRDLYILRIGARLAQSIPNVRSNLVALLDNWAFRFFDELDYIREGENAIQFAKNMESLPNIVVPAVYMQYTSRKVLTTQWVEGEKLSDSKAGDLLQLVKVALNCYLMQLLESGFLHADPHPGNLLRTQNGSLCVLDYGLMTQITSDQKYAFIEYISHLVNADYGLVAEDLVKLGFVPPELVDPEKTVSVVPQLSRVLGELVQGGGAQKINFQQVIEDLSAMSRDYVFVIPPYFALILRTFSVLEGIGLAADPDYAIVQDCYPYLCKRLITDDSPRTRAALKYFVYAGKEQLDVTRAESLITGFQTFQSLTTLNTSKSGDKSRSAQPSVDLAAKQVLALVFSPNGSYLQELLLTELVRVVDALSRDAVAEIWQYFASRALISLPPALKAPKSWPIPLPGLFFGSSRVATLSPEDQQSLEAVKRLWVLLEPQIIQRPSRLEMREAAGSMLPLMSDLFPGAVAHTWIHCNQNGFLKQC